MLLNKETNELIFNSVEIIQNYIYMPFLLNGISILGNKTLNIEFC